MQSWWTEVTSFKNIENPNDSNVWLIMYHFLIRHCKHKKLMVVIFRCYWKRVQGMHGQWDLENWGEFQHHMEKSVRVWKPSFFQVQGEYCYHTLQVWFPSRNDFYNSILHTQEEEVFRHSVLRVLSIVGYSLSFSSLCLAVLIMSLLRWAVFCRARWLVPLCFLV